MSEVFRRDDNTPVVSKALIEWLDTLYPDRITRCFGLTHDEWNQALGEQKVLQKLRAVYRRQNIIDTEE